MNDCDSAWAAARRRMRRLLVVAVGALAARTAVAEEPYLEFVHALQKRGYGDMAIEYLNTVRERKDLPDDVRQVLDLETAESLRVAAANTEHVDEAAHDLQAAGQFLEKFLAEHADHAQAPAAVSTHGDIAASHGQALLRAALAAKDRDRQAAWLADARQAFDEARKRYQRAAELYTVLLAKLPRGEGQPDEDGSAPPARSIHPKKAKPREAAERDELEGGLERARFRAVWVDFQAAGTYLDPADAARKDALERAAAGFDGIYQRHRGFKSGLQAHVWHGIVLEELGDLVTALDIYDEVLANAPEGKERDADPDLDDLFADVEYARLSILMKQDKTDAVIAEAEHWLRTNRSGRRSDGRQGIALVQAKAELARADELKGEAKRKALQSVRSLVSKLAATPGAHQREGIMLQRQLTDHTEIKTFDEALAVAESAAGAGVWEEAASAFARAVELSGGVKDKDKVLDARLQLARAQAASGKDAEALSTAEALAQEDPARPIAPAAIALALHSAIKLSTTAENPAAMQERLARLAGFILKHWPERAEADEARLLLGRLDAQKGNDESALKVFEAVNPASDRYPAALHLAAIVHWRSYLKEKAKKSDARDAGRMAAERGKAVEQLTESLRRQRAVQTGEALPRELMDTQLLLAETKLEAGDFEEAAQLVEPLVKAVGNEPAGERDVLALRVLVVGLKVQVVRKNVHRASEAGTLLVARGDDSLSVNAVLIELARLLREQWKTASAAGPAVTPASTEGGNQAAPAAGEEAKNTLSQLAEHLRQRRQLTAVAAVFLGDTLAELGLGQAARQQYEGILSRIEREPKWLGGQKGLVTRVRSRLIALLRADGNYDEALQQVDRLVQENPKALDPRLERARILESWAEREPQRYPDAIRQWTELRTALQRVQRKPPEYYEVVYHAAACLAAQSAHTKKKDSAQELKKQAEQLLKSTLVLAPRLSGPEMVARYEALLKRLAAGDQGKR